MNEYEVINEKTAEFIGHYLSDKILEIGDVIIFQGVNYFVTNLITPSDRKIRVAVWPVIIYLPSDFDDLRLLRWIQKNIIGMKIKISNEESSTEGVVINYWPKISFVPLDNLKSNESPKDLMYAEEFPGRLEILSLGPDDPTMIDLLDFSVMEILGN
jgi:hypothetical protein